MMINRTNAFAGVILGGLLAFGLYHQVQSQMPAAAPAGPLVTITLPDVDDDKKPDTLFVTAPENGKASVMLTHTVNGRTGEVIPLDLEAGPLSVEGAAPRWTIKDATGATRVTIVTHQSEAKMPPDLVVWSDTSAKRYVWMQRGFLKLDAFTVTPGFAVGLAMVGDHKGVLEAIAGSPDASGMWKQPIGTPLGVTVKFNAKDQVADLTYDTPAYKCDFNLKPGEPLSDLAKQIPARYEADKWIAPNYGLIGRLDSHKKLKTLTVTQPWTERDDK